MKLKQLKALVMHGESEVLEFKETTAELPKAMQTVCAFLNSNVGGTVLIGVKNNGKIIGQEVSDSTRKTIASDLKKIEPFVSIDSEFVHIDDERYVIVFSVKDGPKAPYVYDGRPFMRSQSTTQRMPQEQYIHLLQYRSTSSLAWDKLCSNTCSLKDLDSKRIKQVVATAVAEKRLPKEALRASTLEILERLELLTEKKLTNAAVILFCKDQHKQFMESTLKLARFKGTTKSEFFDEKSMRGNVFDLFEQAMLFLDNYLPVGARIEDGNPFRVTTPAIPYKVLREAVINALCHKDYSIPGSALWIAIYDDRVEIVSSGRLPPTIKLKDLTKKHFSFPRNQLIANVFYACHMIEKWGRGTQEIIELCKKSGNLTPQFEETTGSFNVILPLKEPIQRITLTRTVPMQISARQKKILTILKQRPMSLEQIMEKIKTSLVARTIQNDLSNLKKSGLVRQEGTGRGLSSMWTIAV